MNADTIAITKHAWYRFVTRFPIYCNSIPKCPMKELRRLLRSANLEDLGYAAAIRLLNNGMVPATYYFAEGWRFVLDEDETEVLTIERALYRVNQGQRPRNKRKRRQR